MLISFRINSLEEPEEGDGDDERRLEADVGVRRHNEVCTEVAGSETRQRPPPITSAAERLLQHEAKEKAPRDNPCPAKIDVETACEGGRQAADGRRVAAKKRGDPSV